MIRTVKKIASILTLLSTPLCQGMDRITIEMDPLLDKIQTIQRYDHTYSFPTQNKNKTNSRKEPTPHIPKDIWKRIALNNNVALSINLARTCKSIYNALFSMPLFVTKLDLHKVNSRIWDIERNHPALFAPSDKPILLFPEDENNLIHEIAELKRKQIQLVDSLKINEQIYTQSPSTKGKISISLYDDTFFDEAMIPAQEMDLFLKKGMPHLLEHAAGQNPSLCQSSWLSDDMAYLANQTGHNLQTYLFSFKRVFKLISKNRPLMIGGTILSLSAFALGTYIIITLYPKDAFENFFHQKIIYNSNLGFMPSGYSNEFDACLQWSTSYWNKTDYDNDPYHGPSYIYFDSSGQGHSLKGNLTDWLGFIYSKCGCDIDFWYKYVASIMNGSHVDPNNLICSPNPDNTTICCGSVWGEHTWPRWQPGGFYDYSLRMVSGSALKAQEAAIAAWGTSLAFYLSLGGFLSLTPIWMMLLSYWCC